MQGSKGLMPIIILLAFSLVSIRFGPVFHSTNDMGIQPQVRIFPSEKIVPATWIENQGILYGVWDVRKENDNALMFTIVCVPTNGTLIKDPDISARVLAVRLTLEMAKVVQLIAEQSKNIEQVVGTVENVLRETISIAKFGGQTKVVGELSDLKSLFSQKAEVAFAIAEIVASSKEAAETIIRERNDQEAEHFLVTIASTGIAQSIGATLMLSLVFRALDFMEISTTSWINALHDKITYSHTPLLEALAQTYGQHEVNWGFLQLVGRI